VEVIESTESPSAATTPIDVAVSQSDSHVMGSSASGLTLSLALILACAASCGSSEPSGPGTDSGGTADSGTPLGSEPDLGAPLGPGVDSGTPTSPGKVGDRFWFQSSMKLDVRCRVVFDAMPGSIGSTSCDVWSFTRDALTDEQQSLLDSATLQNIPLSPCTADGYGYCEAIISDQDGSIATYRDTGCDYLKVPDATAILPYNLFHYTFPLGTGQLCQ